MCTAMVCDYGPGWRLTIRPAATACGQQKVKFRHSGDLELQNSLVLKPQNSGILEDLLDGVLERFWMHSGLLSGCM